MIRLILPAAGLCTLVLSAAGQIYVPGDYANLQDAIDAAQPGGVIVVSGDEGPVVIDKALTILGNPTFEVSIGCAPQKHGITLAGPGNGTVVIRGLKTTSKDCAVIGSGIVGGGFDELHLLDSEIVLVPSWTGTGEGNDAIDVDVPFLLVSGCTLRGKGSDSDAACTGSLPEVAAAGIRAPNSQVLLLDSEVTGGETVFLCCAACVCPPAMPDPALGGYGGPGVVANAVFLSRSQVAGGEGAEYLAYPDGFPYDYLGQPLQCRRQADGADFVVNAYHALLDHLSGPPTAPSGGVYQLTTHLYGLGAGSSAWLFAAFGVQSPALSIAGWIFLDPASTLLLGPAPTSGAGGTVLSYGIPPDPALLGQQLGFQALDGSAGLTRPVFAVVAP